MTPYVKGSVVSSILSLWKIPEIQLNCILRKFVLDVGGLDYHTSIQAVNFQPMNEEESTVWWYGKPYKTNIANSITRKAEEGAGCEGNNLENHAWGPLHFRFVKYLKTGPTVWTNGADNNLEKVCEFDWISDLHKCDPNEAFGPD